MDPEIYKDWGACSNFNTDKKEKGSAVRDLLLFRHHSSSFLTDVKTVKTVNFTEFKEKLLIER